MRNMALLIIVAVIAACGVFQPAFENYVEEEAEPTGPASADTECGAAALAIFTEQVGTPADSGCAKAGCHASGSSGATKFPLAAAAYDENRSTFYTYTGLDDGKLTAKISSASHGGGDQSATLPKANISAWLDKEAECAAL
jgi:hypothetical protein